MTPFFLVHPDPILKSMLSEHIKQHKQWVMADTPEGAVIIDPITMGFKFPLRLGQLIDKINYELSGRVRFTPDDIAVRFAGFTLDDDGSHLIHDLTKRKCALTDKEYLIMRALLLNHSQDDESGIERVYLLHHVWGYAESTETHTIETHMYRLRQKLEMSFADAIRINNVNGRYRLDFDKVD